MFSFIKEPVQEFRASLIGGRAMKAMKNGNYTKCIALNHKALEIMEELYGDIPQTIVYVWNIAEAHMLNGQYEDAGILGSDPNCCLYQRELGSDPNSSTITCLQLPLGDDRFQKQIESALGRRIGFKERGRPKINEHEEEGA